MSVIGRLDEQVDAVLIRPLKKRGERQEETATAPEALTHDRPEPSAPGQRQVPSGDENSRHQRPEPDELPVWLL